VSSLAYKPAAFAIHIAEPRRLRHAVGRYPTLAPTEDGWSLVGPAGDLLFRGLGVRGRRECLEFARDRGIVAVMS
jgi:hypothetical protein